jgi:hypothetical protein
MQVPRPSLLVFAILVALAAPAAGCGSSDDADSGIGSSDGSGAPTATTPTAPVGASAQSCEGAVAGIDQLRVTGSGCDVGRGVALNWADKPACSRPSDASRWSCALPGGYRCLAATVGQGIAVSCSHPGRSVSFVAKRG